MSDPTTVNTNKDTRVVRRFLWWPKTLNGRRRWPLRFVYIRQRRSLYLTHALSYGFTYVDTRHERWIDDAWAEKPAKNESDQA